MKYDTKTFSKYTPPQFVGIRPNKTETVLTEVKRTSIYNGEEIPKLSDPKNVLYFEIESDNNYIVEYKITKESNPNYKLEQDFYKKKKKEYEQLKKVYNAWLKEEQARDAELLKQRELKMLDELKKKYES